MTGAMIFILFLLWLPAWAVFAFLDRRHLAASGARAKILISGLAGNLLIVVGYFFALDWLEHWYAARERAAWARYAAECMRQRWGICITRGTSDPLQPTPGSDWVLAGAVFVTVLLFVGLHLWAVRVSQTPDDEGNGLGYRD